MRQCKKKTFKKFIKEMIHALIFQKKQQSFIEIGSEEWISFWDSCLERCKTKRTIKNNNHTGYHNHERKRKKDR